MSLKKPQAPNPMMKILVKQLVPMLREKLKGIDPFIAETIEKIALKENEEYASFLLSTDDNGIGWVITATFDSHNTIKRIIARQKASEFIEILISQI